jgi:retinol dehydrogenase 12
VSGSMNGRVCVVTGATHGIGLATAHALAALEASVVVHGRDAARVEEVAAALRRDTGNPQVTGVHADFAHLEQVRRMAAELCARLPRLDVLINNAGLVDARRARSAEHYDLTFAVNHLAPFLLTNLLLGKLRRSAPARVIIVASDAHRRATLDFDDLMNARVSGLMGAYARSKLANVLFARELAARLEGSSVTVNALHPGVVHSELFRHSAAPLRLAIRAFRGLFMLSPHQGAATSVFLATAPELAGCSGGYYRRRRRVPPSAAAQSSADAARLWQESARLTGLAA